MIVSLSPGTAPLLTDIDRLDRLHAECGAPIDQLDLGDLCRAGPDDQHVWLSIPGARRIGASSAAASSTFAHDFDAMISYAASKGWVDDTGSWVRAHVERTDAPTRLT